MYSAVRESGREHRTTVQACIELLIQIFAHDYIYLCVWVPVCTCTCLGLLSTTTTTSRGCVCACVCVLRAVSLYKVLCYKNTLIMLIIISSSMQKHPINYLFPVTNDADCMCMILSRSSLGGTEIA